MTAWARTEWLDCYVEEGEAVVMLDSGQVVALSSLAWAILESLSERPLALEEVSDRLVARFGAPDGAASPERLTVKTLETLRDAGLVSRV